jgi:hypothetical protein
MTSTDVSSEIMREFVEHKQTRTVPFHVQWTHEKKYGNIYILVLCVTSHPKHKIDREVYMRMQEHGL